MQRYSSWGMFTTSPRGKSSWESTDATVKVANNRCIRQFEMSSYHGTRMLALFFVCSGFAETWETVLFLATAVSSLFVILIRLFLEAFCSNQEVIKKLFKKPPPSKCLVWPPDGKTSMPEREKRRERDRVLLSVSLTVWLSDTCCCSSHAMRCLHTQTHPHTCTWTLNTVLQRFLFQC